MFLSRDRRKRLWASRNLLVNSLRFFAVLLVIFREAGSFFWAVSRCSWPDSSLPGKPAHVLLIADTQYRVADKNTLQSFLFTSYLRRSWDVASLLRPNAIIFLGDMLQDAKDPHLTDIEYQAYVQKFQKTFALNAHPKPAISYLPGNNDIGLGLPSSQAKRARKRYLKHFGLFNRNMTINNHTLVLLDAPGLVEEDYRRAAKGMSFNDWSQSAGAVEHVKSAASTKEPVILFTHIPLHRSESASCGPFREKGTIKRGVGHGYQNTFGKLTSQFLLKELQPRMIFSADNRDYCEYVHTYQTASQEAQHVREVTVKSFSPARYILRPGFHLLSIASPSQQGQSETTGQALCLLPKSDNGGQGFWLPLLLIVALLTLRNLRDQTASRPLTQRRPLGLYGVPVERSEVDDDPSHLRPPPPDGDVWSPTTAFIHTPVSPKSSFPSKLRTPSARHHKPNNSIAYSPALPQPMGTPRAQSPAQPLDTELGLRPDHGPEDEDEAMYPSQYAHQHHSNGRSLSPVDGQPFFLRAPPKQVSKGTGRWSWSWSFVFRGRRRRMTVRVPQVSSRARRDSPRSLTSGASKRVVAVRTLRDVCTVLWPAAIVWIVIVGWLF